MKSNGYVFPKNAKNFVKLKTVYFTYIQRLCIINVNKNQGENIR